MYTGADTSPKSGEPLSDCVVMDLMDGLLDQGRHLYADNWYIAVLPTENCCRKYTPDWNLQEEAERYNVRQRGSCKGICVRASGDPCKIGMHDATQMVREERSAEQCFRQHTAST
ncbi:hypothetical protein KIN20_023403 [Parelaphostrongylus tenuis]|uniref:PiggyBac transposable element-derived protein domain-containing protein n=1 Tax=Parelaphostrongylus tenuis TaxID=148309 RepID=A0AAD5MVK7_PARTN|nr:hypothetical protein KIN20_023403 [Parelaphostrongylus tenuis]